MSAAERTGRSGGDGLGSGRFGDGRPGKADGSRRKRFSPGGLAFVLYVLAEVFAFIGVGSAIGYGWAFVLLVAVSMVGAYLLRLEGPRAIRRLRSAGGSSGRLSGEATKHVMRMLGAILVTLPGFVSAAIGAALFVPPVRALAGRAGTAFAASHLLTSSAAGVVFGPRRVKVKTGRVIRDGDDGPDWNEWGSSDSSTAGPHGAGPHDGGAIEGEIIDPR